MLARIKSALGVALSSLASLARYGSPDDTPDGRWWCRWQNLTKDDGRGDFPKQGRAWLSFAPDGASKFRFEWCLGSNAGTRLGVDVDPDEPDVTFKLGLVGVALYLAFESPRLYDAFRRLDLTEPREVSIRVHDAAVWWSVWTDPRGWSSTDPRWRHGSFQVADVLLGEAVVDRQTLQTGIPVRVPMPEGVYEGTCSTTLVKVGRPRWFAEHRRTATIELVKPIPIPGKGENAWDCGDDAVYEQTGQAETPADAVGNLVAYVLRRRERHGGRNWMPPGSAPVMAPVPPPPPPPPAVPGVFGASPVAQA
jgi:hypothetical protein